VSVNAVTKWNLLVPTNTDDTTVTLVTTSALVVRSS
jgi:hypothetical protein